MAKTKATKRKRGRPPGKKYFSADELREKSNAFMRKSQERLGNIDFKEAEEGLTKILKADEKNPPSAAELKELRRMASRLWDQLQIEKQYEEEQQWQEGYGVRRDPDGIPEVWTPEGLMKKERKNAKKPKNIDTLTDKQKISKGISLEPVSMEIDIDTTEAELERRLMEEAVVQKQFDDRRFLKGRRVRGDQQIGTKPTVKKDFWI